VIGHLISHYRVLEQIGAGGMGVVYKAQDTALERTVALKFLPPELTRDPSAKERLIREARAAAKLSHPNICTVYEIGEHEGQPFIVMECVDGVTLKEKIRSGVLDLDGAVKTATEIADGLSHAHENGIVHRDIKPANIMLTPRGQAKIMDFGIAKSMGGTQLTKGRSTVGTVAYMSPEQTRGEGVDGRTDIWSLGAVLYEMLTGEQAFKGDYEQAVIYSILNEDPKPLRALRKEVPPGLEEILVRCLAKDRAERYGSAARLAADLRELRGESGARKVGPGLDAARVLPRGKLGRRFWAAVAVLIVAAGAYLGRSLLPSEKAVPERKMLVVLPFENLGSPEDEYFADGVTEEITARLAGIHGLGVIARTSSIQYKKTDKTVRQIGEELGVGYILEGTIRWQRTSGGKWRVRVTPQLVQVADGTHLWANVYEEDLKDIFQVQMDVAEDVARALHITLLDSERDAIGRIPTRNLDAYRAYLRGQSLYWNITDIFEENYKLAIQMFERAVELDPGFALAYASLSQVHSFLYNTGFDRTEERRSWAKSSVDRALELEPGLPEAHLALGYYYYWCERDYGRAIQEFETAEEGLPEDPRVLEAFTYVLRRQGKYEEAARKLKKAFELSPRSADLAGSLAYAYTALRRYSDAERYCSISISLMPDQVSDYIGRALIFVLWKGDTEAAEESMRSIPREIEDDMYQDWFWLDMLERDYEGALRRLGAIRSEYYEDHSRFVPWVELKAIVYRFMGEKELARTAFDSARVILERNAEARRGDYRIKSSLGVVYAGLGRKEEAIREGQAAVRLLPVSADALIGPDRVEDMAFIYTMLGEHDAAVAQIEYLLSIPCLFSVQVLRLDPRWDPLREHPDYRRLLRRYSGISL